MDQEVAQMPTIPCELPVESSMDEAVKSTKGNCVLFLHREIDHLRLSTEELYEEQQNCTAC